MNRVEKLYHGITCLDERLIEQAEPDRRVPAWRKWALLAACVCLVLLGSTVLRNIGGNADGTGAGAGGSGHDGSSVFMSYAGPAFPLTTLEEPGGVTAEREITFDFASYEKEWPNRSLIQDRYLLTNQMEREITLTAVYPYVGAFRGWAHPVITVDGAETQTELYSGVYSGTYMGTYHGDDRALNLNAPGSWEDYQTLLRDGAYMDEAFQTVPAPDWTVTVYEFTDVSDGGSDAVNPTLNVAFDIDYDRTIILTYGFNGGRYDPDTGHTARNFSVPRPGETRYDIPYYLIALGDDIGPYTVQGYPDGGCEPGEEMDGVTAKIRRYEARLGEILERIARQDFDVFYTDDCDVSFELYFDHLCRLFTRYGPAGTEAKERYEFGMLEDLISETMTNERVLYRAFPVTVPAGGSVEIRAELWKGPSYDFACTGSENTGVDGYDMVTRLGSALTFTGQTASIGGTDAIEIVRQNFGFDLENGVTTVALDPEREHYYLEIRKK